MGFFAGIKLFPYLESIAFFGAVPYPTPSHTRLVHMFGHRHVVDNLAKAPRFIATTMSKAKPRKFKNKAALVKMEGGHVEGEARWTARLEFGREAGWPGSGELGQGRVSEALAFWGLPLPTALTNVALIGGI